MRVLNDEVPDDGDFDAGRSRGKFDHITPEDITRGTGNPPGWLGADDIADLRSRMPIAYVEIVPVRVDDFGRVTQIGSLLRGERPVDCGAHADRWPRAVSRVVA